MNNESLIYEHPMNERVRNLLRLEHLYNIIDDLLENANESNCRSILEMLLEINDLLIRADVKNEIIKELKRQLDILNALREKSGVNIDRLDTMNELISEKLNILQDPLYHPGNILKNNELVKNFSQRVNIPGGTCNFDLPRLHYWFRNSESKRKEDLDNWQSDLMPIKVSNTIILDSIRKSATPTYENAKSGFYHQQIGTNMPCQLIRVNMDPKSPYYPDINGVKHRFTIRFMEENSSNTKPLQTKNDINFELHCCIL